MIQVIPNTLCNEKDNVILLKCIDELQTCYKSVEIQNQKDGSE